MKVRLIKTNPGDSKPPVNKELYAAWGDQADNAIGQGWRPSEVSSDGVVVYTSPYYAAFNNVVIPNENKYGHIAMIGNKNRQFDIVIRDANGKVKQMIAKGVSPNDVQAYITNANSSVAQRNSSILSNTNPDRFSGLMVKK